jgi:hypothetical protein
MEIAGAGGKQKISATGVILPRCHLCGEVPEKGLRGGIKIKKIFICERCETQIVSLQVGCSEYNYLLQELKKIW